MRVKFRIIKTKHLVITAHINGVKGNFILDTGASNSCVGFECIELFKLNAAMSKTKASGAGATGMFTQIAKNNQLQLGTWKNNDFDIVVIDLSHVNQALTHHKAKPIQGIIGADVLLEAKAIIDYSSCYVTLN